MSLIGNASGAPKISESIKRNEKFMNERIHWPQLPFLMAGSRNGNNFSPLASPQLLGTTCGYFWAELFQSLVNITNSCDRAGTIANELPIVEQIPVSFSLCCANPRRLCWRHVCFVDEGVASLGSFNSHDAIMGQYEGERALLGLEHEHVLPPHPQRHGRYLLGEVERDEGAG